MELPPQLVPTKFPKFKPLQFQWLGFYRSLMMLLETESELDLSRHLSGSKLERLVHLKYCAVGGAGAATLSMRMFSLNWTAVGHRPMRNH